MSTYYALMDKEKHRIQIDTYNNKLYIFDNYLAADKALKYMFFCNIKDLHDEVVLININKT